jgi:uncharacterized protein
VDILIVSIAALAASGLTLFSGFGLGTLLMPVFALFFPVEVAIAQTALVHFANNLFKLGLFAKRADWRTVVLFGGPAFLASYLGARSLLWLSGLEPLLTYTMLGRELAVEPVKLVIAMLMAGFAILELRPKVRRVHHRQEIPPGWRAAERFFRWIVGQSGRFPQRLSDQERAQQGRVHRNRRGHCRHGRFFPVERLFGDTRRALRSRPTWP